MPVQGWKHTCPKSSGTTWTTKPSCPHCSGPQEYDGWRLGMHELMAVYQYVYGLKPIGPHRPMADRLLSPLRLRCGACGGRGLRPGREHERFSLCPMCEGTGGTWSCTPEEVEAIRREVLRAFPDAEVALTPTNFVSPTLALHLASGCIVELTDEP
jgi:hypothetical protein